MSGFAYADADAGGAAERSPGLLSGNLVQLPVHTPVNVCGNTVSVVGVLNSATGNRCANEAPRGGSHHGSSSSQPSSSSAHPSKPGTGSGSGNGGGATAQGRGKDSPGLLSGNGIQLPVDIPLNLSGNSVSVVGIGNSSSGNTSVNGEVPSGPKPPQPQPPVVEQPVTPAPPAPPAPPRHTEALAQTGAEGLGYLLPGGGALLLGGALLYRRFRPVS
ncbi:chaplin [Streptomyces xanthophaeus]|uniref:chaplin n=1 Tax=Streptomyces xanthophaeus TaxID=67385 RepID=UPI003865069E